MALFTKLRAGPGFIEAQDLPFQGTLEFAELKELNRHKYIYICIFITELVLVRQARNDHLQPSKLLLQTP